MAVGTAVVDFGAFPGKADTSVAVTGQATILTTSLVEAWIRPQDATADHSVDEHIMAQTGIIVVIAGNIVAGTGFTIYAMTGAADGADARMYGTFNVNWAWV
jgi:hypothetical protein